MKCPRCESTSYRKNGHRHDKQNYLCKNCGRQFTESAPSQDLPTTEIEQVSFSSNGHAKTSITESILPSITELAETEPSVQSTEGIAILLLDIENLKLDIYTEKFLASLCNYPLQVKIAFANWRSQTLGKQDAEFYERGYQLVHVPGGKDSADAKMIAVGSSLFLHYPNIKEVFVCSCDWVLTHLCNQLQNQGLIVHWVRRQDNTLNVENLNTGEASYYSLALNSEIPSWERLVNKIEALINAEQKSITERIANLSTIASLFLERRQITAKENSLNVPQVTAAAPESQATGNKSTASIDQSQDIKSSNSPESVIPTDFRAIDSLLQLQNVLIEVIKNITIESKQDYVSVNQLKKKFLSIYKTSADSVVKKFNQKSSLIKLFTANPEIFKLNLVGTDYEVGLVLDYPITIKSVEDLEQKLVNISHSLNKKYPNKPIFIENLETEFQNKYGVTITAIMKHLKLEDSFLSFLQSCSAFKVEKSGKSHQVTLA
ncbi:MAG: hypothetical protein KME08_12980 [Aphanothece sp. CMT-3BRIN-NPC111]|jgi:hypothetical protein|nr:hypothetical protein [Aphanothece sp. CMT-3BRIN-NPC111]